MNASTAIQLTRIRLHMLDPDDTRYDLDALAHLSDVHSALITQYVQLGLLDPLGGGAGGEWRFDNRSLYVLRKIQRLRNELGVNVNGVSIILDLLQRVEELEQELAAARRP